MTFSGHLIWLKPALLSATGIFFAIMVCVALITYHLLHCLLSHLVFSIPSPRLLPVWFPHINGRLPDSYGRGFLKLLLRA